MALSYADVPAADVIFANNDKVILVGDHVLANDPTVGRWTTDGNIATSDDTNSAFPVRYAYDRQMDVSTKRTTAATTSYLMFDRGTGTLTDFDVVMVRGDFNDYTTTSVDVVVTDDGDFAGGSGAESLEQWTTFTDKRLVSRDLRDSGGSTNRRVTGGRYVGLKVVTSGTENPQVFEFWLGVRVQLHTREMLPTSVQMKGSNYSEFRSENQSVVRANRASGFLSVRASFKWRDTTLSAEVVTFLKIIQYGSRPFLYLHEPNADVLNAAVVFADSISYVDEGGLVGTGAKLLTVDINEAAPFYENET